MTKMAWRTLQVLGVVSGLTMEQYWRKSDKDVCLRNSDGSTIPCPTLITSLASAMLKNISAVSYDDVSGEATFHDETSIVNTPLDVYIPEYRDCSEVNPTFCSGLYRVTPTPGVSLDVYCDMDTAGGPWTVIHKRQNGSVNFYRNWAEYKSGFGDLLGNFWLGNENLHLLTSLASTLRIELEAWNGTAGYAEYPTFQIANETDNYRILVQGYAGNIVDGLSHINGQQFSTFDNCHDVHLTKNCAVDRQGAWWYKKCSRANLNSPYEEDNGDNDKVMSWREFFVDRAYVPLKKARMMIKRP